MTTKLTSQEHKNYHGRTRGSKDKNKREMSPNSLNNLQPFEVGHAPLGAALPGNGSSVTAEIKHQLQEESEFIAPHARPKDKLWRQQIAREILVKSAQGDVPMVKELLDRTEGKVPEKHAVLGDIVIEVVYVDRRKELDATGTS